MSWLSLPTLVHEKAWTPLTASFLSGKEVLVATESLFANRRGETERRIPLQKTLLSTMRGKYTQERDKKSSSKCGLNRFIRPCLCLSSVAVPCGSASAKRSSVGYFVLCVVGDPCARGPSASCKFPHPSHQEVARDGGGGAYHLGVKRVVLLASSACFNCGTMHVLSAIKTSHE